MKKIPVLLAFTGILAGSAVLADHNSPHGEGWARMPNDIHNTRIDTQGDSTTFRDFVRYGDGASSTNRFLTDSDFNRGSGTGRRGNDMSATDRYFHDSGRGSGSSSSNRYFSDGNSGHGGRSGKMGGHRGSSSNRFASHSGRGGMRGNGRGRRH